jgi:hypothetical protein
VIEPRDDEAFVKGTSLAVTIDLVRERGAEAIARLAEALPPDVRAALPEDLRPLATERYPFRVWAEVLLAAEALYGDPQSIVRESSRRGYRKLFRTMYRTWVKDGDLAESLRGMPRFFGQVTGGIGTLAIEERPHGPVLVLALSVDPRYREIGEERLAGCLEALLEAAGFDAAVAIDRIEGRSELSAIRR